MKTAKQPYVFSGTSDKYEDLTFGDEYLDENYVHGANNAEIPEGWLTNNAEDHTKH